MRSFGLTRRDFLLAAMATACSRAGSEHESASLMTRPPDRSKARLAARPRHPSLDVSRGVSPLKLSTSQRDGLIYVPKGYSQERPAALALMLHGAGGSAEDVIANSGTLADATNTIILAVDSRRQTWDALTGGFGPDVVFIDQALEWAFSRCAVRSAHLAIGGFSDGASYALSVGIANGDLFSHLLAFSPGFMLPPARVGNPQIFISHGTQDRILAIESTSRRLVAELRRAGYRVRYREFVGPHTVPLDVAREALEWFAGEAT